jgi:hypothetical protein
MSKWLAAVKSAYFFIRRVSTYESERKKTKEGRRAETGTSRAL